MWQSGSRIEHFASHKYFLWTREGVHIMTDFIRVKTNENKVFIDWISRCILSTAYILFTTEF